MNAFIEIGNIPVDIPTIGSYYPDIRSLNSKVSQMEKAGDLIRIKKGLYVVSPSSNGQSLSLGLIANHLYGPSYTSMATALSHYGLIPERVFATQSMTTKHTRSFVNALGRFDYISCKADYFPIGINEETEGGRSYLIACPEKALCDWIVNSPMLNLRYRKEVLTFLGEDIRLDMEGFHKMDPEIFERCAENGKKKTMLSIISRILKDE